MPVLDRVRGGEVVVLARVDHDSRERDDPPRKMLVDQGSLHVDVAEKNPVHRVVEQKVQPLHRAQSGDLRHAKPRAVVREPNVAPELAGSRRRAPRA